MKKTILLSAVSFAWMLMACNSSSTKREQLNSSNSSTEDKNNSYQTFNLDTTQLKSGETFYQCEMDPEVLSDQPGNCPKCGMELIEMKKSQ